MEQGGEMRFYDNRLVHPHTMQIVGPSMSGKSTFVRNFLCELLKTDKIVKDKDGEAVKFNYIAYFCGSGWQPEFQELKDAGVKIFLTEISEGSLEQIFKEKGHKLIVTDDNMTSDSDSKEVTDMYTKGAHHNNCSLWKITQNPFVGGNKRVTQNRNTHYWVIFRFKADQQGIQNLMRRMEQRKEAQAAYGYLREVSFGYIILDCHPLSTGAGVRSNISVEPGPIIVFT